MYNVMIVDDELWFRSYLKELIDQSGSEFLVCAQAANGAEALKILAAQPVDIVIADVLMPVMDGFLSKPIDIDELWKTLRRLLQS